MSRTVFVNGAYVDEGEACVSVFDRAFLFADAVYEVSAVIDGNLVDNRAHLARLKRSLGALRMPMPCSEEELVAIQRALITRNRLREGAVYLQVTRGAADRDFKFPVDATPTLVMFTQARRVVDDPLAARGLSVITIPDIRWKRRDIKTTALLAASLAKQEAVDAGADDAWMIEDGFVTEGSSNNAWIITSGGAIVTRHVGNEILQGITRAAVLELSRREGIVVEERPFTVDEAIAASEAFCTSATALVCPVVRIDGHDIGAGVPGEVTRSLRRLYLDMARAAASGEAAADVFSSAGRG
jgi:D-alanine transaminase